MPPSLITPKQLRLRVSGITKLLQTRLGTKARAIVINAPPGEAYILVLPQELLDAILDILCKDITGLKHCTLVLRAWKCRARRHMFREISVLVSRLTEFRDFLAGDPSFVCNSVRYLKIKSYMEGTPVRLRDIHGCCMLLPGMEHLTLSRLSVARSEDGSPLGGIPTKCRFHKLTLAWMRVDARDIDHFLLLCPSRTELRLRRGCYKRQHSGADAVAEQVGNLTLNSASKKSTICKGRVKTLVMGSCIAPDGPW